MADDRTARPSEISCPECGIGRRRKEKGDRWRATGIALANVLLSALLASWYFFHLSRIGGFPWLEFSLFMQVIPMIVLIPRMGWEVFVLNIAVAGAVWFLIACVAFWSAPEVAFGTILSFVTWRTLKREIENVMAKLHGTRS